MQRACRRGRPLAAWMDNIKTRTGLPVEESIRMTEDRDKLTKYVHGVAKRQINQLVQTFTFNYTKSTDHTSSSAIG